MAYSWKPQKYAKLNLPVVSATYGVDFASDIEYVEVKNEVKEKSFQYGLGKNNLDISHLKEGYYHKEKPNAEKMSSSKCADDHFKDEVPVSSKVVQVTKSWNPKPEVENCFTKSAGDNCNVGVPDSWNMGGITNSCRPQKLNVQQYYDHPKAPVEEALPLDCKEMLRPMYHIYIISMAICKIKNVQTFEEWYASLLSATLLKKEKKS
ncbi:uncharacterized protein LOC121385795 isoform X2 [Gigantopelta aegis]|uniref:uncharacterized protein LOC121385795 isoform X2 n=1 Tax=Gigantopelta aegis TaxID=1735272 RepID=UPI001B88A885|nr:uncharacterized protein LOC121385795 isoform X2 [Gigantopelta aegis]